ncbi:MAG: phytanoyl-CoA dioxygenase [Alphaproteobacteria bacterium]|nr:phytanoyl-CoA dioxygenase [Alphaproteobacteria bacterium]PPR13321.1 MAG: hypothetical protein CFH42_01068 [Alphaproteobacteria bacterium MarineAlpha12_Bin1]|tara:strand:- start:15550 stop:16413 length:864 start_codon:yes stop_codon:yes gene_type:complete
MISNITKTELIILHLLIKGWAVLKKNKFLTSEQSQRYELDGFVFPIKVMEIEEANNYGRKLHSYWKDPSQFIKGNKLQKIHLFTLWMSEIIRHKKILDAVEDVLGPNILCWTTTLFVKKPKDPGFVSWHQDGEYWGLNSHNVVTAWLALSPATSKNGCMKMMPGSHKWPEIRHIDTFDDNNLLSRGQVIDCNIEEEKSVKIQMKPGQISLHHVNIAHCSAPNTTNQLRMGIAIRYICPTVKQIKHKKDSATLVRGVDTEGNFELEPTPKSNYSPSALKLHERVTNKS